MKKQLSLLLSIFMVFSIAVTSVHAEGTPDEPEEIAEEILEESEEEKNPDEPKEDIENSSAEPAVISEKNPDESEESKENITVISEETQEGTEKEENQETQTEDTSSEAEDTSSEAEDTSSEAEDTSSEAEETGSEALGMENAKTVMFGNTPVLLEYYPGTYFTKNGKACTDHDIHGIHGDNCNCQNRYNGVDLGGVQCFAYARYIQLVLFGITENNNSGKFTNVYSNISNLTGSKLKEIFTSGKVQPGAHVRMENGPHSFSVTQITDDGITLIHANSGGYDLDGNKISGSCRVSMRTFTYAALATHINNYWGGTITYIKMPKEYVPLDPVTIDERYILPFGYSYRGPQCDVYSSVNGSKESRYWIEQNDDCTISEVYSNPDGWAKVTFPISNGTSTATKYVKISELLGGNCNPSTVKAPMRTDNYFEADCAERYGTIMPGEDVVKLRESGNSTMVEYIQSDGVWQCVWVPTKNIENDIGKFTVTANPETLKYNGQQQTAAFDVINLAGEKLTEGTDYYVENNKATNPGTYSAKIIGQGNYAGWKTASYTIEEDVDYVIDNRYILPFGHNYRGSKCDVYSSVNGTKETGYWIEYNDNCTISAVYSDPAGWAKVTFPISNGTSTATKYVKISELLGGNCNPSTVKAPMRTDNYFEADCAERYGTIMPGEDVVKLRESGNSTMVEYIQSDGVWQCVWVPTKNIENDIGKFTVTANPETLKYNGQQQTAAFDVINLAGEKLTEGTDYYVENNKATNPGTYIAKIIGQGNYAGWKTASYTIEKAEEKIQILEQPKDQTVTAGTSNNAVFEIKAEGSNLTYQWQLSRDNGINWVSLNGSKFPGALTSVFEIRGSKSSDGNLFRCIVTAQNGETVTSESAKLTVEFLSTLEITSHPENAAVKAGEIARFRVSATGESLSYQWQLSRDNGINWVSLNGSKFPSALTSDFEIKGSKTNNNNLFRCVVKDQSGQKAVSNIAKLTVRIPSTLEITSHPGNTAVNLGVKAKFHVTASGEGLSYQWQLSRDNGINWVSLNGSKFPSALTSDFEIKGSKTNNDNLFRCVITDKNGKQAVSNYAKLTVTL